MATTYGVGQFTGSTYIQPPLDIYIRNITGPTSYDVSPYSVTADAFGDKIVFEGTVLALSSYDVGAACPYDANSGTTVLGVLVNRVNLRNGVMPAAVQMTPAVLNEAKCRDNGVFGTVRAGSKTALANKGIYFQSVG